MRESVGFELSQATVAKYLVRHRKPPSQNWCTLLLNHMQSLVSADFFVAPTTTFRLLFVFVCYGEEFHERQDGWAFAKSSRLHDRFGKIPMSSE